MTIGVGFLCTDGAVLCSDRQITSTAGFKYEEDKIFRNLTSDYAMMFSYAGDPDTARILFRRIIEAFADRMSSTEGKHPIGKARSLLESIFEDKITKGMETLIAVHFANSHPWLFKTKNSKVVDGVTECIGVGDSSAIRYISDFLLGTYMTVEQAEVLGSYLVFVANRYVDGCNGGPDVNTLRLGTIGERRGMIASDRQRRFLECETEIGRMLRAMLFSIPKD